MSKEYDQYWKQREQLQHEVQKTSFKPMSFEIFAKTPEEKESLKTMKRDWKQSQAK